MRGSTIIILLILICSGCKKYIQQQEQNAIIQQMTNSKWKITGFFEGSNNNTIYFVPYTFQFFTDNTVQSYKWAAIDQKGTWSGNLNTQTISTTFSNASNPIDLLNGTWKITSYTDSTVLAQQTISGEIRTLQLSKL